MPCAKHKTLQCVSQSRQSSSLTFFPACLSLPEHLGVLIRHCSVLETHSFGQAVISSQPLQTRSLFLAGFSTQSGCSQATGWAVFSSQDPTLIFLQAHAGHRRNSFPLKELRAPAFDLMFLESHLRCEENTHSCLSCLAPWVFATCCHHFWWCRETHHRCDIITSVLFHWTRGGSWGSSVLLGRG